ncbi:MAG: serine hydrolase [Bacteroidota bacterium]|jgi:CubicO group peptidase (beta-lactamase class C family)|nr:serine hydrolase [Bacteroidota bacterium]
MGRTIVYNLPDVNDHKIFPFRTAFAHDDKFIFTSSQNEEQLISNLNVMGYNGYKFSFDSFLLKRNTLAFLIIQDDTIRYEKYFNNFNASSQVPSFSIAKAVTSTLVGCAIDDGYIKSVEEPITNYIPELKCRAFDKVKIKHLLQMTSGIAFSEDFYHLRKSNVEYYYGINIRKKVCKLKLKFEPGKKFEYSSVNAELLGVVLERALETKSVTEYLQERIWHPLGMEFDATWSLDRERNGVEKTFCCLNARARDYAKLGRLYMNEGNWNGRQVVSKEWIKACTTIDTTEGSAWNYQHQWWIASDKGDFYARGMLGQYVYVNPAKKLIIVRLGQKGSGVDWPKMFITIADQVENKTFVKTNYISESRVN